MSRIKRHEMSGIDQYNKMRKQSSPGRSFLRGLVSVAVIVILVGIAAFGVYATICISRAPSINPKALYENVNLSSTVYDDRGKPVDVVYYDENRRIIKYKEIPDNLKNAFVAIEDKTFWKHHGFNFKRMVGAVIKSIFGSGNISGTSTITQQLARNVYLPDIKSERSIKRKIIEMYYAYQIEKDLSKEDILEGYLNTIYLGYGCYGVNSAAMMYFSKDVGELTLQECASLAALPQAPDLYALLKNKKDENCKKIRDGLYANDVTKDRRYLVLDLMADQDYITEMQAAAAKKPLADFINPNKTSYTGSSRSYFKDYLIACVIEDLMEEYGKTKEDAANMVYTKGLKIYSTLDSKAQDVIYKEFKNDSNFPISVKGKYPQAAMVITEIGTGAVKAMVGGRKAKGEMLFNRATNTRQPGSSIKPLSVYGAALQKSYELQKNNEKWHYKNFGYDYQGTSGYGEYITTSSTVIDEMMHVNGQIWPYNSSRTFSGYNTFRTALQQSINTCAVKIQLQLGTKYSADMLQKFGITSIVTDESKAYNDMNAASLALGGLTHGVSPLEMSLAYAAFPNGGYRNTGYTYNRVEDRNGRTLLEKESQEFKVIDEGVAWIMTDVLKTVVSNGIAKPAAISGIEVGGKTGTTNDQYDIWFDGFTPSYSASLWIGTDNNVSLTQLSGPAAALWGKIMKQIPAALEGKYKKMPKNVTKVNGEYYTKGTEPSYFPNENAYPSSNSNSNSNSNSSYYYYYKNGKKIVVQGNNNNNNSSSKKKN